MSAYRFSSSLKFFFKRLNALLLLGKFTKKGSSLLVASIGGGALIPLLFGAMKDWMGAQNAYWICLPFYLLIMFYAYYGYKIRR